jgi:hypothetical protein
MHVGTVAAGRIGLAVLRRLKPFDVKFHYTENISANDHRYLIDIGTLKIGIYPRLSPELEVELGLYCGRNVALL